MKQADFQELRKQVAAHLENFRDLGIMEIPRGKMELAKEPAKELTILREEVGNCTRCRLSEGRTNLVFGDGNPKARLMFIGEGPGRDEDLQGKPFVGRAGQLLTKMIEAMGLKREEVYINNIVMCRPPDNRYPEPDEVATCFPFLLKRINAIRPEVIVTLGNLATKTVLQTTEGITTLRGNFQDFQGIQLMPTYHPAFLLRNPNMKKPCWEDLQKVMGVLGLMKPRT